MTESDVEDLTARVEGMNIQKGAQSGRAAVADEGEPIVSEEPHDYFTEEIALQPEARSEELDVVDEGGPVVFVESDKQLEKERDEVPCLNEATKDDRCTIVTTPMGSTRHVFERVVPSQKSGKEPGLNEETKEDNSDVTTNPTLSKWHLHRRVDSHQENEKDSSTVKLDLIRLQEELSQTKNELREASARNDELSKEFERCKARSNFSKKLQAMSKATTEKKIEACQKELGDLKARNQYFERRDSEGQQRLDGRYLAYPQEDISFYKHRNHDMSTDVSLIRTWNFPIKRWWKDGMLREEADKAAIGYMRLYGQTYVAKSGRKQDGTGFIKGDYWAQEALLLADLVGTSFLEGKHYETHVEPQLVAFCVTRRLEELGRTLNDFGKPSTYEGKRTVGELEPIIIYVSEDYVCRSCKDFIEQVNFVTKMYGYHFEVVIESV